MRAHTHAHKLLKNIHNQKQKLYAYISLQAHLKNIEKLLPEFSIWILAQNTHFQTTKSIN